MTLSLPSMLMPIIFWLSVPAFGQNTATSSSRASTPKTSMVTSDPLRIGALTTTFTPPPSCITNAPITTDNNDLSSLFSSESLFNNGPSGAAHVHTHCFPSGYPHNAAFYYSPGLCPSGWTLNTSPAVQQNFETISGETVGVCCPSRYFYNTGGPLGCFSYLNQPTSAFLLNPTYVDYYGEVSTITTSSEVKFKSIFTAYITTERYQLTTVIISSNTLGFENILTRYTTTEFLPLTSIITSVAQNIESTPITYITTEVLPQTSVLTNDAPAPASTDLYSPTSITSLPPDGSSYHTYYSDIPVVLTKEVTISTTASVSPGTVYASAIQVRWKSSDHLHSHPLSSGAKAGIGIGVVLAIFIIIGMIPLVVRRRRSKRYQYSEPESNLHGEPRTFIDKPELQASKPTDIISPSVTKLEHASGETYSGFGTNLAATSVQGSGNNAADIEDHSSRNLSLGRASHPSQTRPFELPETASITSDSAIKREQVPLSGRPVSPSIPAELGLNTHPRPNSNPDSTSPSQTTLKDSLLPPENLLGDETRPIELPITEGDIQPLSLSSEKVASPTVDDELAWLETERDRIRERRERLREMQGLKREEEKLAAEEDQLRKHMRAVKHREKGSSDNEVV
jgi:hypothetical protein